MVCMVDLVNIAHFCEAIVIHIASVIWERIRIESLLFGRNELLTTKDTAL